MAYPLSKTTHHVGRMCGTFVHYLDVNLVKNGVLQFGTAFNGYDTSDEFRLSKKKKELIIRSNFGDDQS